MHPAEIRFDAGPRDLVTVRQIVRRALEPGTPLAAALEQMGTLSPIELEMDLVAVHMNVCALRLDELLLADEFNFSHDILGIRRHLNRQTGELGNCFMPRFATRKWRHS
jgi:hypothetical protein